MYRNGNSNAIQGILALLVSIIMIVGISGCKTQPPTVVEKEKVVYVTKDTTIYKDSTVYVPYEVVKDYSLDTLVMKTSLAISKSWVDTSTLYIVGELKNLKSIEVKYIEKEVIKTKDSIVEVEKPIPVEVEVVKTKIPTIFWLTFIFCIGLIIFTGIKLYLKFKPF